MLYIYLVITVNRYRLEEDCSKKLQQYNISRYDRRCNFDMNVMTRTLRDTMRFSFVAKDFQIKYGKYCDRIYKILVVLKTEIQDKSGEILNS